MQLYRSCIFAVPVSLLVFSLLAISGCGPGTQGEETDAEAHGHHHDHDHEHGHRPDSLHEAVEHLTEIQKEIRSALESSDAEAAHEPLHEVAELLKAVPDIAAETDLPKEHWEAVKTASDRLFDAYAVIDKAFHAKDGDKQAAYEQVAGELTKALDEIRLRLPMTGEEVSMEDHEHEHEHDHEHDHHDREPAASDQDGAKS